MIFRRRSFLLKFCIAVALFWLGFVLLIGRDGVSTEGKRDKDSLFRSRSDNWGNEAGQSHSKQPVIERPDLDRLRFEQAMRRSAEEEAQRRHEAEVEKERLEEERRRRLRDRVVPPFMNMASESAKSPNASIVNGVDLTTLDEKMRSLIEQGLIVPKWDLVKESTANPVGTGNGDFHLSYFHVHPFHYHLYHFHFHLFHCHQLLICLTDRQTDRCREGQRQTHIYM